jgi:isovaleryl-CoA dehydrogenase
MHSSIENAQPAIKATTKTKETILMTSEAISMVELLVETARAFSQDRIASIAAEVDTSDQFPLDLWPQMGEVGLFGITVEEEYGGLGLGYLEHAMIAEEVSRASGSIGLSYVAHSNLCVNQLRKNGTEKQKWRYLPDLLTGEKVGCLAMSETGAGSDVVSMRLRAEKKGDSYVLNGSKMWITNAICGDVFIVYAKTDPGAGSKGISAFIIEKGLPGFSTGQTVDKLGMRGSGTAELLFEDCAVPATNLLGAENSGVKVLMSGLDYERIVAAGASLGLMQAAFDAALPYAQERQQFGRAIGEFQLIQGKLADMYTSLNASRAYVHKVAREADSGGYVRKEAASAILFTAERATQAAMDAIQILGGNGYTNEYPVARIMRDAKLYEIGAGTSEIRRMLIGRELVGNA